MLRNLFLSFVLAVFAAGCADVEVYQNDDFDASYDYICSNDKTVTLTDSSGKTYTIPACNKEDVIRNEEPQPIEKPAEQPKKTGFWHSLWGSSDDSDIPELEKVQPLDVQKTKPIVEKTTNTVTTNNPAPAVLQNPQTDENCIIKMYDYQTEPRYVVGETMPRNKHKKQIMLEDLNTRMVVFCRGSQEEMENCAENMSNAGYVRVTDIPKVAAKYDVGPQRGYPARRWREGDVVPRW